MTELTITRVPSVEDRYLPVFAEVDQLMQAVQRRAYELFEARGSAAGWDLDDWLAAERELCGPEFEVTEDEAGFRLEVPVGGFERGDLDVTATPYELVVRASRDGRSRPAPGPPPLNWPAAARAIVRTMRVFAVCLLALLFSPRQRRHGRATLLRENTSE